MKSIGTNSRGVMSRTIMFNKTAAHFNEALAVLVKLLKSNQENIALGAANKIIDKCIPDVKYHELGGRAEIDLIPFVKEAHAIINNHSDQEDTKLK